MWLRVIVLSWAVDLRILNSLPGRRIVVMNSGECMRNSTRKKTTTSLFAVSRTTILGCAMVVQCGRSTAEGSMIPTTTEAWGNTLVEIQESWSPCCNPRSTTRCTVACTTACTGSSRAETSWSWYAVADDTPQLQTLSCGRTRWPVAADVNAPFLDCTFPSWISGKTLVQGTVRSANNPSEFSKHTTIQSKLSVYDVFLCPIQWQAVGNDHDQRIRKIRRGSSNLVNFEKASDKGGYIYRVAEPWTNWQKDSGIFTTAPVYWPVVHTNTTFSVKQTREWSLQPSACFTDCGEKRVMIWNVWRHSHVKILVLAPRHWLTSFVRASRCRARLLYGER